MNKNTDSIVAIEEKTRRAADPLCVIRDILISRVFQCYERDLHDLFASTIGKRQSAQGTSFRACKAGGTSAPMLLQSTTSKTYPLDAIIWRVTANAKVLRGGCRPSYITLHLSRRSSQSRRPYSNTVRRTRWKNDRTRGEASERALPGWIAAKNLLAPL